MLGINSERKKTWP